ncbi:hypothetical protein ACFWOY_23280 [Streptomyces sp. NPDC058423]|uniref:hypothetical protein n=1 Tax=unclassified Streptomyces TaxID=2593676 RepID=UPI003651781E
MTGVIGLDLQHSRSMVVLREGEGVRTVLAPVGDGIRYAVPNACDDQGRWGSAAAEASLVSCGDPGSAPAAADLLCWRRSPWSEQFLRGLHGRLSGYLGQVAPTPRNGYQVVVSALTSSTASDGAPPPADLRKRCAAAGLTDVATVDPTDALLCRWLTEPDPGGTPWEASPAVVAVVCGETWTSAAAYRIEGGRVICARTYAETVATGTGTWCTELALQVLARCRPGVPTTAVLALLDGVGEFATGLRATDADRALEWSGPLADRMYAPLRLTRRELLARQEVRAASGTIAALVSRAVTALAVDGREAGRPLILVGGCGASWPFLGDALSPLGTVRQSSAPSRDLAAGAAWWPLLRTRFDTTRPTAAKRPGASTGIPSSRSPERRTEPTHTRTPGHDDVPPWLRP